MQEIEGFNAASLTELVKVAYILLMRVSPLSCMSVLDIAI